MYRTLAEREKRAVAGLSMGGYGALKFGCKRPDLFTFAASMSGAFEAPRLSGNNPGSDWENLGPSIEKVFGSENSRTRIENDLFQIIREISPADIKRLPHFYIACGTGDSFLEVNRKLVELMETKEISLQYDETFGGHEWNYWDKATERILQIAENKLT